MNNSSYGPCGEDETVEPLGPYFFIQKKSTADGQRFTEDSFLLSDFILPLKDNDSIIDLGTGTGIIPHLLAWKSGAKKITGVEIMEEPAKLARRNAALNSLSDRIDIIQCDWRELTGRFTEGSFSVVISNPPYFKAGAGRKSPFAGRNAARTETFGGLDELLHASSRLAGAYGRICYVFTLDRLEELLDGVKSAGLKPKRIFPVRRGVNKGVFLIELARRKM